LCPLHRHQRSGPVTAPAEKARCRARPYAHRKRYASFHGHGSGTTDASQCVGTCRPSAVKYAAERGLQVSSRCRAGRVHAPPLQGRYPFGTPFGQENLSTMVDGVIMVAPGSALRTFVFAPQSHTLRACHAVCLVGHTARQALRLSGVTLRVTSRRSECPLIAPRPRFRPAVARPGYRRVAAGSAAGQYGPPAEYGGLSAGVPADPVLSHRRSPCLSGARLSGPLPRVAARPFRTPFLSPPARAVRPNAPHPSRLTAENSIEALRFLSDVAPPQGGRSGPGRICRKRYASLHEDGSGPDATGYARAVQPSAVKPLWNIRWPRASSEHAKTPKRVSRRHTSPPHCSLKTSTLFTVLLFTAHSSLSAPPQGGRSGPGRTHRKRYASLHEHGSGPADASQCVGTCRPSAVKYAAECGLQVSSRSRAGRVHAPPLQGRYPF